MIVEPWRAGISRRQNSAGGGGGVAWALWTAQVLVLVVLFPVLFPVLVLVRVLVLVPDDQSSK